MLSWFRFQSRVNSSLIKQKKGTDMCDFPDRLSFISRVLDSFFISSFLYRLILKHMSQTETGMNNIKAELWTLIYLFQYSVLLIQSIHSVHVLSHKYLAVWPFSQEVLWSLSFPGGSFGFLIHCPVWEETNSHFISLARAHANTGTDWNKSPTFLSQSSDSPRFSNYSSSPRCQEYAVRDGNNVKVQHFR